MSSAPRDHRFRRDWRPGISFGPWTSKEAASLAHWLDDGIESRAVEVRPEEIDLSLLCAGGLPALMSFRGEQDPQPCGPYRLPAVDLDFVAKKHREGIERHRRQAQRKAEIERKALEDRKRRAMLAKTEQEIYDAFRAQFSWREFWQKVSAMGADMAAANRFYQQIYERVRNEVLAQTCLKP